MAAGYGRRGKKFKSPEAYHQSFEGQRHAAHPELSKTPVGTGRKGNKFFSKARFLASKNGPMKAKTGLPGIAHPHPPTVHRKPIMRKVRTYRPKRG
jgi:hypothetical protein